VIVKMKLTVLTADERIVSLDVEPDELVENLKAILEVEVTLSLSLSLTLPFSLCLSDLLLKKTD
jgi:hypothetical protein